MRSPSAAAAFSSRSLRMPWEVVEGFSVTGRSLRGERRGRAKVSSSRAKCRPRFSPPWIHTVSGGLKRGSDEIATAPSGSRNDRKRVQVLAREDSGGSTRREF